VGKRYYGGQWRVSAGDRSRYYCQYLLTSFPPATLILATAGEDFTMRYCTSSTAPIYFLASHKKLKKMHLIREATFTLDTKIERKYCSPFVRSKVLNLLISPSMLSLWLM